MAAQGYITPAQEAEAAAAPLGPRARRRPRGAGACRRPSGAYVCDFVQKYLTQTLGLYPAGARARRLRHPDDAGPRAAAQPATPPCSTPLAMGDSRAATFTAVEPGTGHLLAMSVNRIFGYDLQRPDAGVVQPQRGAEPGRRARRTRCSSPPPRWPAATRRSYTLTDAEPVLLPGLQRRGRRPVHVENAGTYRSTLDLTTALYQSSNTYFLALEDALGSVEEPVRMAEEMGLYQFGPDGLAQTRRSTRTAARSPSAPTRPARSAWPAPTPRSPPSGTQCDVVPVTEVLDRFGEPLPGDDGEAAGRRRRARPEAIPPGVADTLNQMLRKDVEPGIPAARPRRAAYVPRPPDRRQDRHDAGQRLGRLRRLHARRSPPASWCSTPSGARTSAASAAARAPPIWHDAMAPILQARGSGLPAGRPRGRRAATPGRCPGCTRWSGCRSGPRRGRLRGTTRREIDSDQAGGRVRRHQPAARRPRRARPGGHDPGQQRVRLRRAAPATRSPSSTPAPPRAGRAPPPARADAAPAPDAARLRRRRADPPALPRVARPGAG